MIRIGSVEAVAMMGAYNPPMELQSSTATTFFEEAKANQLHEQELLRKFKKFAPRGLYRP